MSAARLIRPLAAPAVLPGPTQLNRLGEHYQRTLLPSLLYMTFDPTAARPSGSGGAEPRRWDPSSPYTALRPARPARGNRRAQPGTAPQHADPARDVPRLERVVITSFSKDAIANKNALVPLVAQLRAITGARVLGSAADASVDAEHAGERGYVKIVRAKGGAASFKIRPGMPVGAQAVLPGPAALDLIEQLTTFVLPRLRSFQGFALPPSSQPPSSPAALSGVVSLGFPPEAMALWPGTETNWDAYPGKPSGFQIDCITSARGPHATEQARQLLSGLGVPFVRRGDMR